MKREPGARIQATEEPGRRHGWPTDYHDYVFRNGELVGDFDNMYRYATDVPWHQDTYADHWCTEVGFLILKAQAPYGSILEIGCGLGYIAAKLKALVQDGTVDAFDISEVAVREARRRHPGIQFYVDDITDPAFRPRRRYELVVVKDLFWYVLDHLQVVLRNLETCVASSGRLYLCQWFPDLAKPFVGKDVIPSPEALLARMSGYAPLATVLLSNDPQQEDGPILHVLGKKR